MARVVSTFMEYANPPARMASTRIAIMTMTMAMACSARAFDFSFFLESCITFILAGSLPETQDYHQEIADCLPRAARDCPPETQDYSSPPEEAGRPYSSAIASPAELEWTVC